MTFRRWPALAAMAAACAWAQSVEVCSEFQRVDPFGRTLAADRADAPREILSPLLARNAHFTFQAVLHVPRGLTHWVYVAQNPDNAVRVAAYYPVYVNRGGAWIPDELKPLEIAADGRIAEIPLQVPGQSVRTLWIDLWVDARAPVRRTRLEVQLKAGEDWIIYPMELRVHELVAPPASWPLEPLAAAEASAAEPAAAVWRGLACGAAPSAAEAGGPPSVRALIRRNARQDAAFARALAEKNGRAESLAEFLGAANLDPARWCKGAAAPPPELGAEWCLRLRSAVYRRAEISE